MNNPDRKPPREFTLTLAEEFYEIFRDNKPWEAVELIAARLRGESTTQNPGKPSSESGKPILCLDFDGVIHSYDRGWQNGEIYGEVTLGFFDWLLEAQKYFHVVIYSSRSKRVGDRINMSLWLQEKFKVWKNDPKAFWSDHFDAEFAHEKPPAWLTIDDRALTFNGNWQEFNPQRLLEFRPWNSRENRS